MNRFRVRIVLMILCGLQLTGCGGGGSGVELVPVRGTVTLDGKPLEGARVTFFPQPGGRPSYGQTDPSGHYELVYIDNLRGAIPGTHKITISTFVEPNSDSSDPLEQQGQPETVPSNYNSQSTLTTDIEKGGEQSFTLTSG